MKLILRKLSNVVFNIAIYGLLKTKYLL